MPKYLSFLTSNRFHALLVLGFSIWAFKLGWIPKELMDFLNLVLGGHVGLKTIDRASEYIGGKKK